MSDAIPVFSISPIGGEVSKMPTLRKNCIYSMAFNT